MPRHTAALCVGGLYLVFLAVQSLSWPMYQDAPIMLYAAWLIDRVGLVPYRDFFDNQMPGTYGANVVIGRLSGYSAAGVRWVDLSALGVALGLTFALMRRFGRVPACVGVLVFGILYLGSGEWMSLQREFLLLIPTVAAMGLAVSERVPLLVRAAGVGVLMGVVATIKPHAALAWPALVGFLWTDVPTPRTTGRVGLVGWSVAGFLVPVGLVATWLWQHDALAAFLDGAIRYWPLYGELSGSPRPHVILTGGDRAWYVVRRAAGLGGHPGIPLAMAAVIGATHALSVLATVRERRIVWAIVAVALCAWSYTALAGKFYLYHWLPLNYVCGLLGALGFVGAREPDAASAVRRSRRWREPILTLALVAGLPWRYGPFHTPFAFPFERVQEIAAVLSRRMAPGDTVAPLDWTEGAAHAMLLARAPLGLPMLYDFHLYHHVSSPVVQDLRRRVLATFEQSPPRFVVRVPQHAFAGPDTADFPELLRVLDSRYERIATGTGYEIWERRR